jgi:hypothetical protein
MTPIPPKFHKAGQHPVAATVGDLKRLLQELPDDLRLEGEWGLADRLFL